MKLTKPGSMELRSLSPVLDGPWLNHAMKAGALLLVAVAEGIGPAHAAGVGAKPLLVVPGADQVVIQGKSGAVTSVEFEIREPYPALQTIGFLVETLAERGWQVAMPGTFGPARPSARPRSIAEAHRGIHVWEGR